MRRCAKSWLSGVICLAFLSACGGMAGKRQEQGLSTLLRSLSDAGKKGEVGSVEGNAFLLMPGVSTPLKNWPAQLIPLSPTLEATIAGARERFVRDGRAPLSAEGLRRTRQPINDYLKEVERLGYGELIKTVKTGGQEPRFTFSDVPAGRWLLMAELPSKISVLLWALPVTVTKGEAARMDLDDGTIWLEGLTP